MYISVYNISAGFEKKMSSRDYNTYNKKFKSPEAVENKSIYY